MTGDGGIKERFEIHMGNIIHLRPDLDGPPGNLITSSPWEFRKAAWKTTCFVRMPKSQSAKLEREHKESHIRPSSFNIPPHFSLEGSAAQTIRAMYAYRENEKKMREVYYLIGLMDCMINQVNPLLRTDLLRDMYKKVVIMKQDLNIRWYGPLDRVFLPVDSMLYNEPKYRSSLNSAHTMKELYQAIRNGTDEMFDVFSMEYVFYCPGLGGE